MMACGLTLAAAALQAEVVWDGRAGSSWLYEGGSDGARALLSTIAASIITVGGVAFSITIVTLTQASQQFGPRLLRNFMQDRSNQLVLGTFVGTFAYCLVILRTIRSMEENVFVPQVGVSGAFALALLCLAVLVYFIHHTSLSLQAPVVIAGLGRLLQAALARHLMPGPKDGAPVDREPPGDPLPSTVPADGSVVEADRSGYLQVVDLDVLLDLAQRNELVWRLAVRPGDFVIARRPLLTAHPAAAVSPELDSAARQAFIIGEHRTEEQDAHFVIRQLVEVAIRALSPGINDPFTAMGCVDWLAASLTEVARCGLRAPHRGDLDGRLRVVAVNPGFAGLLDAAFDEIRRHARGYAGMRLHLLAALAQIGAAATVEMRRREVRRHVEMVYSESALQVSEPDYGVLHARYADALEATRVTGT